MGTTIIPEIKRTVLSDWIQESEVMVLLNLKATALWKLKSTGQLPYSKVGRRVYYRRQDLEKLLENNLSNNESQ